MKFSQAIKSLRVKDLSMKQNQLDLHQQKFVNAVAAIIVKHAQKEKDVKNKKPADPKKSS